MGHNSEAGLGWEMQSINPSAEAASKQGLQEGEREDLSPSTVPLWGPALVEEAGLV